MPSLTTAIITATEITQTGYSTKLIFRSIDRSLRPIGHMPWLILHLWGFLCIREGGRRGNKITVYSVLLSKWTYKSLSLAMYMWGRLCMTILYTLGSRELAWKPPRYKSQLIPICGSDFFCVLLWLILYISLYFLYCISGIGWLVGGLIIRNQEKCFKQGCKCTLYMYL